MIVFLGSLTYDLAIDVRAHRRGFFAIINVKTCQSSALPIMTACPACLKQYAGLPTMHDCASVSDSLVCDQSRLIRIHFGHHLTYASAPGIFQQNLNLADFCSYIPENGAVRSG